MDTVAKLQEDNTNLLTIIQELAGPWHTHHPPQYQSTTQKWDLKGYCLTHGYCVSIGHTSKTCQYKKPGNQEGIFCVFSNRGNNYIIIFTQWMQTTSSPTPSNPVTGLNSIVLTIMCMHTSVSMDFAHSCTNLIIQVLP